MNEKTSVVNKLEGELQRTENEFKRDGYAVEIWEPFNYEEFRRDVAEAKRKNEKLFTDATNEKSNYEEDKKVINLLLKNLREEIVKPSIYRLEPDEVKDIQRDPEGVVEKWNDKKYQLDSECKAQLSKINLDYDSLFVMIDSNDTISELVKAPLVTRLKEIRQVYGNNLEAVSTLKNIKEWAEKEAEDKLIQQQKAEDAISFWSERVARRVVSIIHSMRTMVGRMKVKNAYGRSVELVRFKHGARFPESKTEVESLVKAYCTSLIYELMQQYGSTDKVPKTQITKRTNISEIVLSVMGEFPRIQIYIPDASGNFLKEEVKPHLYKEWNVINNGGEKESSNSGGQTLMAHLIVLCMLLKQQNPDDGPGLLLTDNMFGEMSAPELIEPLFVVLELLQVQWVTVCPPNIKLDITSKFDSVFNLDITSRNGSNAVDSKVTKYQRRFLDAYSTIEHSRKERRTETKDDAS